MKTGSLLVFWGLREFVPAEVIEGRCTRVVLNYCSSHVLRCCPTSFLIIVPSFELPCTLAASLNSGAAHLSLEQFRWFSYCPKVAFLLIFCEPRGEEILKYTYDQNLNGLVSVIASLQRWSSMTHASQDSYLCTLRSHLEPG